MKDYYKTRITAEARNSFVSNIFDEIITIVLKWLEQKYGVFNIQKAIHNRDTFVNGGSFIDKNSICKFSIQTIGNKNKDESRFIEWACMISEYPLCKSGFIPRKWITEIGYRVLSNNTADISFYMGYEDLDGFEGKQQSTPKLFIPRIASLLLSSKQWNCSMYGKPIDTSEKHYIEYKGKLFGFSDCQKVIEKSFKTHVEELIEMKDELQEMDEKCISLCRVNRPDSKNNIWMRRLADYVGGTLIVPAFNDSEDSIQGNRKLIFCDSGPQHTDNIGFWKWTDYQNENGRWVTSATYISDLQPTEIIILDQLKNVGEIIEALKSGLRIPTYVQGKILFAVRKDDILKGVLCDLSKLSAKYDFSALNDDSIIVSIKKSVQVLPYYEVSEDDVFAWKSRKIQIDDLYIWEYRRVLKKSSISSVRQIPVYSLDSAIKQLFTERLTWPVFKAEGITKSDWRKVIELLKSTPKDTMVEQLSATYGLSDKEAQERIEAFLYRVDQHINVEDVDSGLIVKMIENHKGLKESCDKIAYQRWLEEHKSEIKSAQAEVDGIRRAGEKEANAAEKRLSGINESIAEAEHKRMVLASTIEQAETRVNELKAEIERYEKLGTDTVAAVRQRIAESQNDIAGFIADLSMFLPQTSNKAINSSKKGWQYICATSETDDDDIEIAENWKDELNLLSQNLSYSLGVNTELCEMLSAFLYSAYINHLPLLVIGPGGQEVADCVSSSLFASVSGKLIIGNGLGYDIPTMLNNCNENIISVRNMFGEGWNDELPQMLCKCNKQIFWTHPYTEDMLLEPKGLYNYMIPIFSETFVESITDFAYYLSKRSSGFEPFDLKNKSTLRVGAIKQLGISNILLNQIETVLSGAKAILKDNKHNCDLEILFGLLPLSVLTQKTDVLKEAIENESTVSEFVKEIASKYCNEE